jgi:hypothetical protein
MDWVLVLALATFGLVLALLWWNRASVKRNQETGGRTSGLGGPADPMAGAASGMRDPDAMRADIDAATAEQRRR